ncbi:MAG: hypothetical protein ORN21_06120 [Methylophilaceae bacterium]|nr:hypothetical protein [Methylophilaceae bacterium]
MNKFALLAMFLIFTLITSGCSKLTSSSGDEFVGWWTMERVRGPEFPKGFKHYATEHIIHDHDNVFIIKSYSSLDARPYSEQAYELVDKNLVANMGFATSTFTKVNGDKLNSDGKMYVRSTQEEIDNTLNKTKP